MWHFPYDPLTQQPPLDKSEFNYAKQGIAGNSAPQSWEGLDLNKQPKGNQKAEIWQQDHYLSVDSGIHSGQTSQAPSVSRKFSLDDDYSDHEKTLINSPGQPDLNSPCKPSVQQDQADVSQFMGYESAAAPLPVNMSNGHEHMNMSNGHMNTTNEPGLYPEIHPNANELLQQAVVNLMSYQEESDITYHAVPELLQLINDDDPVVRANTCFMVFQLSRRDQGHRCLVSSPQMVASLIQILNHTPDPETLRFAVGTLHNLSYYEQGLQTIFKFNGVPVLVSLLGCTYEPVLSYSITTLHNLLLHQEGTKFQIRGAGGVARMISLLNKQHVRFLAILTDCLRALAFQHQETKLMILTCGGPKALIRIMQEHTYEKLLWTTSRVLKILSVCPENKRVLIEFGGLEALGKHLRAPSKRLVLNCCVTLRNLSDLAINKNIHSLLQDLLFLLSSTDKEIISCVLGCLGNLTCNNPDNKLAVFENRGIEALVKVLSTSGNKDDIVEDLVRTLKHITRQHPGAEMARATVFMQQNLPDYIKKCL